VSGEDIYIFVQRRWGWWGRSDIPVLYGVRRLALEGVCVWEEDVLSECEQRHLKADGVRTAGLYTP